MNGCINVALDDPLGTTVLLNIVLQMKDTLQQELCQEIDAAWLLKGSAVQVTICISNG